MERLTWFAQGWVLKVPFFATGATHQHRANTFRKILGNCGRTF
jgi:hypothetical protein